MPNINPPAPPVVGGIPHGHSGEDNHPIELVVIHSAVMQCRRGAARLLGQWNRAGTTAGSWHYAVDPFETIQCSYDRFVCWADGVNDHHLAIEMADWPAPVPTVTGAALDKLRKSWRWRSSNHRLMLDRTARLTAELLVAYDLPVVYRGAAALKAGRDRGWTTHAQVTRAYRKSVHWDPGFWPRRRFARLVTKYATELKETAA